MLRLFARQQAVFDEHHSSPLPVDVLVDQFHVACHPVETRPPVILRHDRLAPHRDHRDHRADRENDEQDRSGWSAQLDHSEIAAAFVLARDGATSSGIDLQIGSNSGSARP
jgi:hypothetical protein